MKKIVLVFFAMSIVCGVAAQEGVVINGVTWATHNVGAPGEFVAEPEDFGNYYTFKQALNACPEGWRMPTLEESVGLADHGGQWTKLDGVAGMRFAEGDDSIFLPAAGRRNKSYRHMPKSQYVYVGQHGFYWTDTPANVSSGYDLIFYDKFVGARGVIRRSSGLTVRCVKQ